MSKRLYRVYHRHSETRVVAVTDIVAQSRKQAIRDSMEDALRWNWGETRENMVVKYLECEGVKEPVRKNNNA